MLDKFLTYSEFDILIKKFSQGLIFYNNVDFCKTLIKKTNRGHGYSEEATITRLIFKDGNYVELSDLYTDLDKSSLTKIAKFFDIILVDKEEDKPEDVFLKNFPHSNNVDLEMIKDIKEEMSNYGINFKELIKLGFKKQENGSMGAN